jgi:tRNA threonylcarbamoyladenosine biosynthesis protein TsaB
MRVLALDTSTLTGSVAIVEDDHVVVERVGDSARPHAARLPSDLLEVLSQRGLSTSDVDVLAVASGPGSFTGLRIGIATMQGLAFVHRRRIAAVSVLEALAHEGSRDLAAGSLVGVWMDARRSDVFSALYRVEPAASFDRHRLREIEPPQVGSPSMAIARWLPIIEHRPIAFVGNGAVLFEDVIRSRHSTAPILGHPPLAGAIGRLAIRDSIAGLTLEPADVRPLYIRRPDAEIERDRRGARLGSLSQ